MNVNIYIYMNIMQCNANHVSTQWKHAVPCKHACNAYLLARKHAVPFMALRAYVLVGRHCSRAYMGLRASTACLHGLHYSGRCCKTVHSEPWRLLQTLALAHFQRFQVLKARLAWLLCGVLLLERCRAAVCNSWTCIAHAPTKSIERQN